MKVVEVDKGSTNLLEDFAQYRSEWRIHVAGPNNAAGPNNTLMMMILYYQLACGKGSART